MPKEPAGENLYAAYIKARFNSKPISVELEREARHAFFVGIWACLGLIKKCPNHLLAATLNELSAEAGAEIKQCPDEKLVNAIMRSSKNN